MVSGIEQYLVYRVGLITGAFYQVLGEKNKPAFINHVMTSLVTLFAISVVKSSRDFLGRYVGVAWRKHLTNYIHGLYFNSMKFYKLTSIGEYKRFLLNAKKMTFLHSILELLKSVSFFQGITKSTIQIKGFLQTYNYSVPHTAP